MLIKEAPAQLTEKLWMLGTGHYPFFLYRGETQSALFEGAIGAMGPVLREQIVQLNIDPSTVKQMIVTHAHPDHVMAVPLCRELFPEVTVAASDIAASTLAAEKAIMFFRKMDDALTESLAKAKLIGPSHRRPPMSERRIAIDRALRDGDTIDVDETSFRVLETPGHSPCSLSFYEPTERILIISDATGYYLPDHDWWWPCYFVNYGEYMDSIRRLAEFDTEVLCLGHNGVIKGSDEVKTYFAAVLAANEAYHQRIVADVKSGKTVREIAEALGQEVYDKSPLLPLEFFQKNCSLSVKQSLKHEGIEQ